MAETRLKSETPEKSMDEKTETDTAHSEDASDGTSNHESLGGASMDDPIVTQQNTPPSIPANQNPKKTLCKQPSNGIHVLKPENLTQNGVNGHSYQNGDTPTNQESRNAKEQIDEINFDPNGSYYMANACCELIHYRTAAIFVGVVELALIAAWGVLVGFYYTGTGGIDSVGSKASIGTQAVVAAGFILIIIMMLIGVLAEHPRLLWPHMVVQILGISLGIAFTVVAVIAMCAGTSLAEAIFSHLFGVEKLPLVEKALGPIWPFCLAVVFDFGAALGIWFYIVIKGCYEYLMDKEFFEKHFQNTATMKKIPLDSVSKKPS